MALSSQIGLTHAANARPYALLALQVSLATLVYFRIALFPVGNRQRVFPVLFLVLCHALGVMNHPIYLFFMVGGVIAAVFISRQAVIFMVVCSLVALAIYLLLWSPGLQTTLASPRLSWMHPPTLIDLVNAHRYLWGAAGILVLVGCVGRMLPHITKPVLVIGIILAVSSLLPFVFSQFKPVFNPARTPMLFLPLASILIASLIARSKPAVLTSFILAVIGLNSILDTARVMTRANPFPTRDSVEQVVARAHCGDTFILGALSFSAVEYELRRLERANCIQYQAFPLSTQTHPGWMDVDALLLLPDALEREAISTAEQLAAQPRITVWLFYIRAPGDYHSIANILKWELDRHFNTVETLELRGLYFDSILVYSNEVTEP
jgi:hypothetical protein